MVNDISFESNEYNFRNLSIMADKANIGLGEYLNGEKNEKLLHAGITFCIQLSDVLKYLETADENINKESKALISIFKDSDCKSFLKNKGFSDENIIEDIKNIKSILEAIISSEAKEIQKEEKEKIIEIQKKLFNLSLVLHKQDINRLNRIKKSKILKIYG